MAANSRWDLILGLKG